MENVMPFKKRYLIVSVHEMFLCFRHNFYYPSHWGINVEVMVDMSFIGLTFVRSNNEEGDDE